MKLLTLAVPTYNRKESCLITVNNFISQIIENKLQDVVEIFISDNCSTDGTTELLTALAEKYPDILRLKVQDENIGMGYNFVYLIENTSSKYIQLCSDDDIYHPEMISKTISILKEDNIDYLFLNCHWEKLKINSVELKTDLYDNFKNVFKLLLDKATHISPTVVRTDLIKNIKTQNLEWTMFERVVQLPADANASILKEPLVSCDNSTDENHWLQDKRVCTLYFAGLLRIALKEINNPNMKDNFPHFSNYCKNMILRFFDNNSLENKNKKYKKRLKVLYWIVSISLFLLSLEFIYILILLNK